MDAPHAILPFLDPLNTLAGGLFLLAAFGIAMTRQAKGCLNLFIAQSLLLAVSALLLGLKYASWHLYGVALVNVIAKPVLIPWILRRTVPGEVYTRREIEQVLNIPISLLIALSLAILAFFLGGLLQEGTALELHGSNVPIGIAGVFIGAYTLTVRREALPLLIGLLAMENGAFFAGIVLARKMPLLVELAICTDGLIVVFITGVLIRAVHRRIGTTGVGTLSELKEHLPGRPREEARQ